MRKPPSGSRFGKESLDHERGVGPHLLRDIAQAVEDSIVAPLLDARVRIGGAARMRPLVMQMLHSGRRN